MLDFEQAPGKRGDSCWHDRTALILLFASLSSCSICLLLSAHSLLLYFLSPLPYQNSTAVKRGTRIVPSCVFGHSHKVYLFQHFRCAKCATKYRNGTVRKNLVIESKATTMYFISSLPFPTVRYSTRISGVL